MAATKLDHINIRTARLAESVVFYRDALGMPVVPPPGETDLSRGVYVQDAAGVAIVHLVAAPAVPSSPGPVRGKAQRGMVDHFALACSDPAGFRQRLKARGVPFDDMVQPETGSELIFVRDPNEVLIELNFTAG